MWVCETQRLFLYYKWIIVLFSIQTTVNLLLCCSVHSCIERRQKHKIIAPVKKFEHVMIWSLNLKAHNFSWNLPNAENVRCPITLSTLRSLCQIVKFEDFLLTFSAYTCNSLFHHLSLISHLPIIWTQYYLCIALPMFTHTYYVISATSNYAQGACLCVFVTHMHVRTRVQSFQCRVIMWHYGAVQCSN